LSSALKDENEGGEKRWNMDACDLVPDDVMVVTHDRFSDV
jgi:hypothetical protein